MPLVNLAFRNLKPKKATTVVNTPTINPTTPTTIMVLDIEDCCCSEDRLVGWEDGRFEGNDEGCIEGFLVGCIDGRDVGCCEGRLVGWEDG